MISLGYSTVLHQKEGVPLKANTLSSHVTQADALWASDGYRQAKEALMRELTSASQRVSSVRAATASAEQLSSYQEAIKIFNADRGRDLFFPFLSSGLGNGPFVELRDGSVKYDMITGIGINFFGHSHPEFMSTMIDGISADVQQGNLEPGFEAQALLRDLVDSAAVGSKLQHGWLTTCGTMANEIALKIIRQKRSPATKVLAFEDCFSGRSTAMQEITDNPKYREGQPVYGEVQYLPVYRPKLGLARSIELTVQHMRYDLDRYPGKFCAIVAELVQGEGGFRTAPPEFFVRVFEEAKKNNLAVWIDEVQTFGRTGELFAFQKFGLQSLVDVVTVGKMLQACAVLYTSEFNPKPGLVAGTFSGATTALRTARTTLRMLKENGFLGQSGKIEKLAQRFESNLKRMAEGSHQGKIGEIRVLGGMVAVEPTPGTLDACKQVLNRMFQQGVVAFYCGHGPYLIRMLPPLGAMTESHVDEVCEILGRSL
jgi:4-aminobutyrate aminotransferase-like enzyme